jgi:hypothetical protein
MLTINKKLLPLPRKNNVGLTKKAFKYACKNQT